MDIIDTQIFYGTNPLFGLDVSVEKIRGYVGGQNDHVVRVMAIAASPDTNPHIADVVHANQDVFAGAYLVIAQKDLKFNGMTFPKSSVDELRALASREEIRGFKLHTSIPRVAIDDVVHLPYFALAAELDKPVLVHCSSSGTEYTSPEKNRHLLSILNAEGIDGDVILAHMGGFSEDMIEGNLRLARDFSNVYYTTTGISGEIHRYETRTGQVSDSLFQAEGHMMSLAKKVLDGAMHDAVLSRRILFGTDYGVLLPDFAILEAIGNEPSCQMMKNARLLFKL